MTVDFAATTSTGHTVVSGTMTIGLFASAALSGHGAVVVTAKATHNGAAALVGHGAAVATGAIVRRAAAAIVGHGAGTAAPSTIRTIAGTVAPAATVAGLAVADYVGAGTVPAVATVAGASAIDRLVAGVAPASVSVIGNAEVTSGVAVSMIGHGAMVAAGAVIIQAGGTAPGHSGIGLAVGGSIIDVGGSVVATSGDSATTQYIKDVAGVIGVHSFVVADVYVGAFLDIAGAVVTHSNVHAAAATQIVSVLDIRETGGETTIIMRPALRLPSPFAPNDLTFTLVMGVRGTDGLDVLDPPMIPGPILDDGLGHYAAQPVIRLDIVVAGPVLDVQVPMAAPTGTLPTPASITLFTADQLPALRPTFTVGGAAMNVTGATIRLLLRKQGLTSLVYTGTEALLTIVNAGAGVAEFDWGRALSAPGIYLAHFQMLDAAGRLLHSPTLELVLERSL